MGARTLRPAQSGTNTRGPARAGRRRLHYEILLVILLLCLISPGLVAKATLEIGKRSEVHRQLGDAISEQDLNRIDEALSSGDEPVSDRWRSIADGNVYVLNADRSFDTAAGPCRSFDLIATIQQRRTAVQGLACRKHGHWHIVE